MTAVATRANVYSNDRTTARPLVPHWECTSAKAQGKDLQWGVFVGTDRETARRKCAAHWDIPVETVLVRYVGSRV